MCSIVELKIELPVEFNGSDVGKTRVIPNRHNHFRFDIEPRLNASVYRKMKINMAEWIEFVEKKHQ